MKDLDKNVVYDLSGLNITMRKVTILQVLLSVSIIQVSNLILHYYNVLNNLLLVWLPTILLFGIIILTIFITWFSYKYFNNGRGNWND